VRFVGHGDRFQIWAPATHQPRLDGLRKLALESSDLLDAFEDEPEPPPQQNKPEAKGDGQKRDERPDQRKGFE
jgi:hypothetical protein